MTGPEYGTVDNRQSHEQMLNNNHNHNNNEMKNSLFSSLSPTHVPDA